MASIRPSGSPPPPPSSTPVEAWAVRLAFGFMIVGMAGFVVYDLLDSGRAKASTESDEPTVEEVAPPAHTTTERQPSRPSRFSKSGRGPAAVAPMGAAAMGNEETEPAEEIATNMVAPPTERASRSFLGSPMGRMRPGGMEMHPPSRPAPVRFEPRAEPEPPPPPEPTPAPPPEQPVEQPVEQPTDQPTDQPEQPTEEPEQPEQPDQPIDQPEQIEPVR